MILGWGEENSLDRTGKSTSPVHLSPGYQIAIRFSTPIHKELELHISWRPLLSETKSSGIARQLLIVAYISRRYFEMPWQYDNIQVKQKIWQNE